MFHVIRSFAIQSESAQKNGVSHIQHSIQQPSQQRSGGVKDQVVNIGPSWQEELGDFYQQRGKEARRYRCLTGSSPEQRHAESDRHKHDDIPDKVYHETFGGVQYNQIAEHIAKHSERDHGCFVFAAYVYE